MIPTMHALHGRRRSELGRRLLAEQRGHAGRHAHPLLPCKCLVAAAQPWWARAPRGYGWAREEGRVLVRVTAAPIREVGLGDAPSLVADEVAAHGALRLGVGLRGVPCSLRRQRLPRRGPRAAAETSSETGRISESDFSDWCCSDTDEDVALFARQ